MSLAAMGDETPQWSRSVKSGVTHLVMSCRTTWGRPQWSRSVKSGVTSRAARGQMTP